jgi:hypothetical protein
MKLVVFGRVERSLSSDTTEEGLPSHMLLFKRRKLIYKDRLPLIERILKFATAPNEFPVKSLSHI